MPHLVKGASRGQRRLAQDDQLAQGRQSRGIDLSGRAPRGFGDDLAEHRLVIGPEEAVQRHEGDGLGVVQGVLELHPARPCAERHHGRPDQGAAEGGREPLGAIAHQEGDRLPGANAHLPKATGHRRGLRIECGIGQPLRRPHDGFLLGNRLGQVRQEGPDRAPFCQHGDISPLFDRPSHADQRFAGGMSTPACQTLPEVYLTGKRTPAATATGGLWFIAKDVFSRVTLLSISP